jgi:YD repeat-containing protein
MKPLSCARSLVLGAIALNWLVTTPPATAAGPALHISIAPPGISNEFSATPQLSWEAEDGVSYVIETSTNLAGPAGTRWRGADVAVKSSAVGPIRWMAPESIRGSRYYRVVTQPTIRDVQPAFVNSDDTNAVLYIIGQLFPSNAIAFINGHNFNMQHDSPGGSGDVWSISLNGLPPGEPILGAISVLDPVTSNVVATLTVQSPILYGTTLTDEQLQGPPEEPPASPTALLAAFLSKKGYDYYQAQSALNASSKKGYDYYQAQSALNSAGMKRGKPDMSPAHDDDADGYVSKKGYDYYQAQSALQSTGASKKGYDYYQAQSQLNSAALHNNPAFQDNKNEGTMVGASDGHFRTIPHSGEVQLEVTDLAIPGAMLDFAWTRTYRSRTGPNTAQGAGWDFSFNVSLTQNGDGTVTLRPGNGRADTFYPNGTNGWSRDEYFCQVIDLNSDSYPDVLFADTSRWIFNGGAYAPTQGKLAQIIDPNGNTISVGYDNDGRIQNVIDDLGRTNWVSYDGSGKIGGVTDFSGRTVSYEYDTDGNLTACISPATSAFPGGITNRYTYTSGSTTEQLNHNLISCTDGKGQTWLEVLYQTTNNPASIDFDRVDKVTTYKDNGVTCACTHLRTVPQTPSPTNGFAVIKTVAHDGVGNVTEYFSDSRGRCVRQLDYTGRCDPNLPVTELSNRPTGKLRAEDPDYFETMWTWNADSLCTLRATALGDGNGRINKVRMTYEREFGQANPRKKGDLRVLRVIAPEGEGGDLDGDGAPDISELSWYFEYDPRFGSSANMRTRINALETKLQNIGILARTGGNVGVNEPLPDTVLHAARQYDPAKQYTVGDTTVYNNAIYARGPRQTVSLDGTFAQSDVDGRLNRPAILNFTCQFVDGRYVMRATDPRGNVATAEYDDHGNCLKSIKAGHYAVSNFKIEIDGAYNTRGQLTAVTNTPDADGYRRVDAITYYTSGPQNGYVQSVTCDLLGHELTHVIQQSPRGRVTAIIDPLGNDWLFDYNELDLCTTRQTPQSSFGSRTTTTFTYDANGDCVQSSTGLMDDTGAFQHNVISSAAYDFLGRCLTMADQVSPGLFITNRFTYDANSQLALAESPLSTGGVDTHANVLYEHDERRLPYRVTTCPGSPIQNTVQFDYDSAGLLSRINEDAGGTPLITTIEHDGFAASHWVETVWNKQCVEKDTTVRLADQGFGRPTKVTDAMGNETRFTYDRNGNCTLVRSYGETVDMPGGKDNRLLAETRFKFDDFDRCVQQVDSFLDVFTLAPIGDGAATTTFTYALNGVCIGVTDDNGHTTSFGYDTAGRLSLVTDPKLNTVSFAYDDSGNVTGMTQTDRPDAGIPQQFVLIRAFNKLLRLTRSVDNVGNTNSYDYDSLGRVTRQTDPNGGVSVLEYDDLGRWNKLKIDQNGDGTIGLNDPIWSRQWNDNSQMVSVTDANANVTRYAYDSAGNCTTVTNADLTTTKLIWSPRSNLLVTEDATGSTVTNTYDLCDRIIHRDIAARNSLARTTTFEDFGFDGLSRCVSAINDASTNTFVYDSMGNCQSSTEQGWQLGHVHDAVGNRLSSVYPSGRVVTYTYDAVDEVSSVSTSAGGQPTLLASFSYAGPGRLAKITRANGTETLFQWDGRTGQANAPGDHGWQQVRAISHQTVGGSVIIDQRVCTYDRNQNRTSRTQTVPFVQGHDATTNLWDYDGQDQMKQGTIFRGNSIASKFYRLDGNGNRLTVTNSGVPEDYIMDATSPVPADFQMNQYSTTPFGSQFFDEVGNLVGLGSANAAYQYVYDYANRLVSVTNIGTGAVVANYAYDTFGRRIRRTVFPDGQPPVMMEYLHLQRLGGNVLIHGDDPIAETYVGTTLIDSYVHKPDDGLTLSRIAAASPPVHYHQDDLGNVLALTDQSGAIIERYDYGDFGEPSFLDSDGAPLVDINGLPATESAVGNPFLFQGMEWDGETAFYHDGGSYFDCATAQFVDGRYVLRAGVPLRTSAWSLKKEEGGRHTPFHNKYRPQLSAGKVPRSVLKEYFQSGDKPTQAQFGALIDSLLHYNEDRGSLGLRAASGSVSSRTIYLNRCSGGR